MEFAQRGFHGTRVQSISHRAGCNVALLYRHWPSKKSLYAEILRTAWQALADGLSALLSSEDGPSAIIAAHIEANMRDPVSAQIVVREILDGAPFLAGLIENTPALVNPLRNSMDGLQAHDGLRPDLDPKVAVLTISALSAMLAAAHGSSRAVLGELISTDTWCSNLHELLLRGVLGPSLPPARHAQ